MRSVFKESSGHTLIEYGDIAIFCQMMLHNRFDVNVRHDFAAHDDNILRLRTIDELFMIHVEIQCIAVSFLNCFQHLLGIGKDPAGQAGFKIPNGTAADMIVDRTAAAGDEHAH
ncbi:hypothetical protein SDC9_130483 [bioreactor metagenome]|uniref:Uncharacterized protein n=1 Tax=bioreactor metagenome TaxID=1076179 RepID=A0A645D2I4_9ZZZZ